MVFPVIALKKERDELYVFLEENKLKVTSEELLYQRKIFDGVEFIDSVGKIYKILSVKKTGWGTALFGYSLMQKGRLIKIDFVLQEVGQTNVQNFKNLIVEWGRKKHPYFQEIEEGLAKTDSYSEMINLLS
jgi:hypothetical protein